MKGLYIGRFQPFHKGHYEVIRQVMEMKDLEYLVIAVGSSKKSYTVENPFTAGERTKMIWLSLKEEWRKKCFIVPVDDANRFGIWVAHVEELVPEFDTVIGNNPLNSTLFADRGYDVLPMKPVYRNMFNGTKIREMMRHIELWEKGACTPFEHNNYVPKVVEKYLDEIGGPERIRGLAKTD